MKVEWAEIVKGTERPVGIGVTGAHRCTLRVDGNLVAAILKRGPREQIIAEAFCAMLLRAWGLTVPSSYLVDLEGELAFASADTGYPNLSQRLGIDALHPGSPEYDAALGMACNLICSLPSAPLAATADEAIDNRDRNLGNVLWDGVTEAWIDHAHALGNAEGLMQDVNKLCLMANASGVGESFSQSAIASWMMLDRKAPQLVASCLVTVADLEKPITGLSTRLASMGNRLLSRFPAADDLLSRA